MDNPEKLTTLSIQDTGTVPQSNRKIVKRYKIDSPTTNIWPLTFQAWWESDNYEIRLLYFCLL